MSEPPEPDITINGVELNLAQSMTVRVALSAFWDDMDTLDTPVANAYVATCREIVDLMFPKKEVKPAVVWSYPAGKDDGPYPPSENPAP